MHVRLLQRAGLALVDMTFRGKLAVLVTISVLLAGETFLVYATGGVRFVYVHFAYIPILLGGFAFGIIGGIGTGIAAGLLLGPLMPQNTTLDLMQETHNWILRLALFVLIGGLIGTWSDALKRHLRELAWLHEHHEDTGLLNLAGLIKRLDEHMRGAPDARKLVVSITQLDNFLEIQNTFGSSFGMRVLAQVVERAKSVVPPGSLVALLQPDRLATVMPGEAASQVTRERIESAVKESYLVDGLPIHVEASVGVAHFPDHASTAEELLQKASIAMHWAATRKSGIALYDSEGDRTSRDNLILLGTLPKAIERNELVVWHQAKLKLSTGQIAGTEALLRWKHPERGMVPPGFFIPQAEETTLINPVTHVVIAAAFADAGAWRAGGHRLHVSVNLSVRNLRDRMLLDVLEQHARRNDLEPRDIELEITESAVMADPDFCIRLIAMLRERGYGVAIDDFGVGHSSLSYLQKLRVSTLKIDQEFVKTLASDANNQKIVQSIIHLAKSIGLETVAEGVEDDGALALLRAYGCDYGQGYGIHRPAPSQDFMRFLEEGHRSSVQRAENIG
jgi:diguanylate cyclase (GGDEF)-like protein